MGVGERIQDPQSGESEKKRKKSEGCFADRGFMRPILKPDILYPVLEAKAPEPHRRHPQSRCLAAPLAAPTTLYGIAPYA